MTENRVVALRQKGAIDDPLTEILRAGARRLIARGGRGGVRDISGPDSRIPCFRMAANAWFATGMIRFARFRLASAGGGSEAEGPRSRPDGGGADPVHFEYPAQMGAAHEEPRRVVAGSLSARDFRRRFPGGPRRLARQGRAQPLRGGDRGSRSKWEDEYRQWQKRDLSARHYVYVWADGVDLQARMEPQAECMLVLMGPTPEGRKELIGFQTGMRESGQSWKELLVDLKARGLSIAPAVAVGDGALGFWKALDEAFPTTRHQRCWLHKTLNVLDKLPKSLQPNAHKDLREIWLSPSRARGGSGDDDLRREIRAQIRQGRRMPDQGSADTADVLGPSRRSLGPLAEPRTRSRASSRR